MPSREMGRWMRGAVTLRELNFSGGKSWKALFRSTSSDPKGLNLCSESESSESERSSSDCRYLLIDAKA